MIQILIDNQPLNIPADTVFTLTQKAPWYDLQDIQGDILWSFNVRATDNQHLLGFVSLLHASSGARIPAALHIDGAPFGNGTLIVQQILDQETLTLGLALSPMPTGWGKRKLAKSFRKTSDITTFSTPLTQEELSALTDDEIDDRIRRHKNAFKAHLFSSLKEGANFKYFPFISEDFRSSSTWGCYGTAHSNLDPSTFPDDPYQWVNRAFFKTLRSQMPYDANATEKNGRRIFPAKAQPDGYAFAPAISIAYIIRRIITDAGYTLAGDFFDSTLAARLYHQSLNTLDAYPFGEDRGNLYVSQFIPGDYMPDLTNADLLQALAEAFGLCLWFDPLSKTVEISYWRNILTAAALDVTPLVESHTRLPHAERSITLQYDTLLSQNDIPERKIASPPTVYMQFEITNHNTNAGRHVLVVGENRFHAIDKNGPIYSNRPVYGNNTPLAISSPLAGAAPEASEQTTIKPNLKITDATFINAIFTLKPVEFEFETIYAMIPDGDPIPDYRNWPSGSIIDQEVTPIEGQFVHQNGDDIFVNTEIKLKKVVSSNKILSDGKLVQHVSTKANSPLFDDDFTGSHPLALTLDRSTYQTIYEYAASRTSNPNEQDILVSTLAGSTYTVTHNRYPFANLDPEGYFAATSLPVYLSNILQAPSKFNYFADGRTPSPSIHSLTTVEYYDRWIPTNPTGSLAAPMYQFLALREEFELRLRCSTLQALQIHTLLQPQPDTPPASQTRLLRYLDRLYLPLQIQYDFPATTGFATVTITAARITPTPDLNLSLKTADGSMLDNALTNDPLLNLKA